MKTPATNKLLFIILVLFFAGTIQVFGQSGYRNENELKTQANELFTAADYSQAFPLYSQLLSLDPKNPDLNYRFGVCLLYTDKSNKEEAIKYLEKAINQVSDVDFYYHLGYAYQSNYFFTDALYNYRKYLQLARNKAKKDFEVERKISMCQNGLEMLKSANDLYVMQKSEVEQKSFYRSYDLSEFGGRFLNLPEEFLSKADLKNNENKVSYFNPQGKLLFYSLENKNQKDLYYRIKQSNGDWSEAYLLSATINTPFDEDYPFLMPDGKTLYFSSKGHNTIGGYDLFRTVYDSATKQWNTPVNLSFPFNTPSDDILFISDANETMAWFASNRNSTNNQITVYKVGIIKKDPNATDLTDVYGKEKLSGDDLGKIKNMAKLDINISDKAFKEIPENQKSKLESLVKNDAVRQSQNIRQANLINIDKQIDRQEMQTGLNDSIKKAIIDIDKQLEQLKSLYLQAHQFVGLQSSSIKKEQETLTQILENAQRTGIPERRADLINQANNQLFLVERLNFEHEKLSWIEDELDKQGALKRMLQNEANAIYGDIQKNIVTRNEAETRKNIHKLKTLILEADTLRDYTKTLDFSTGKLKQINYPSNLIDEKEFVVYTISDTQEYLAPIQAIESRYAAFIPEINESTELTLLKNAESAAQLARSKNKQFAFQLKLAENIYLDKKTNTSELYEEANSLAEAYKNQPTNEQLTRINKKFAEVRQAAFEANLAKSIYDSIEQTGIKSEKIANELSSLKTRIELLVEQGQVNQAITLQSEFEQLEKQANALPDYEEKVNFETKTLVQIDYPKAIQSTENYQEYQIENQKLLRRSGTAFTDKTVDDLIENSIYLQNESPTFDHVKTESKLTETSNNEPKTVLSPSAGPNPKTSQEIREKLVKLNQDQNTRIKSLLQQSVLLTQKASEKLDASNAALLSFETMREQYGKGEITDQKAVLAKQKESQDLLYQSMAIKNFAERMDSIYRADIKSKDETTNQIFAIEQALQNEQTEKALVLYRVIEKKSPSIQLPVNQLTELWITEGSSKIPEMQTQANQAFEKSQELTDASIKLIMDAKKIREDSENKSNAFKRRELIRDAEIKENEAVQKQNEADAMLALGSHLYEEIKKTEAVNLIASEFSAAALEESNTTPILNPEKQKIQLAERLETREVTTSNSTDTPNNTLAKSTEQKFDASKIPELKDLIGYETKRYKAQLIAEELDLNKRETVHYLELGKQLSGEEAIENERKIKTLRQEAESLQKASSQAFIDANKIFEQLPAEDKKQTQKNKNDFEHYLNNVRNRIAQLLDEVTLLSEKAASADDEESKNTLMQQADEKEQIAMYLILEEFEIIAQRNKQSFRKNSLIIEKLISQNLSKQEKELMQAIFAQINNYMLDAENKRVKAVQDELSFNVKKMLLQDAFTLESSALDLQLEAIRMMREKDVESMLAYQPKKENTTSQPEIEDVPKSEEIILAKEDAPLTKIIPKLTETQKENNTIAEQKQKEEKAASELREAEQIKAEQIKAALLATEEANKRKEDSVNQAKLVIAQKQQTIENHPKENQEVPVQKAQDLSTEIAKIANQEKEIEIETKPEVKLVEKPNTSDSDTKKQSDLPQIFPQVKLEQIPTGTIFTVQIAAVGNLLSSQNFMNVIELFTIKDKEKELYRYFSGKFETLTGAIIRRNALRQQGYSDAFIKSWKAGENVSILEAAGPLDQTTTELLNKTTIALPSKYRKINFAATSISQLSGVYYTVQVGVYSRPRSSTQLFGIKPLYHNRLNNGYWVYFNGIFKTIADAESNKDAIRTKGVADAFVVAFKEGEKVSVSDARKALQQGTKTPKDEDIVILEDVANAVDQELADVIGNIVTPANVKRVYKVQIGVYSRPVSMEEIQNKLGNKAKYIVQSNISSTGKYIYTIGNFDNYSDAANFNTNYVKEVIPDAFVVGFENGKKVKIVE